MANPDFLAGDLIHYGATRVWQPPLQPLAQRNTRTAFAGSILVEELCVRIYEFVGRRNLAGQQLRVNEPCRFLQSVPMASVATIATPLAGALAVSTASAATRYAQPVVAGALPARRSIAGAALRKADELL